MRRAAAETITQHLATSTASADPATPPQPRRYSTNHAAITIDGQRLNWQDSLALQHHSQTGRVRLFLVGGKNSFWGGGKQGFLRVTPTPSRRGEKEWRGPGGQRKAGVPMPSTSSGPFG